MGKSLITAIIVAKNEDAVIEDALRSVEWCGCIIHVDNGSTDQTRELVKKYKGRTISTTEPGYNQRKNVGLKTVQTDWVIYLDADERITPSLREEINNLIHATNLNTQVSAYEIPRRNIYLGKEMKFGGWGRDYQIRLFKTRSLVTWEGELHEQPVVSGVVDRLEGEIIHFSHRDIESMVEKTITFTQKETDLLLKSDHPRMASWRIFRIMLTEFSKRFIKLQALRDGAEGVIDGLFQVFNSFVIYARLWENQRSAKKL